MKHGSNPVTRVPRRQIHKHLNIMGTTLPTSDFCLDRNISWPNQDTDQAPTECVGYTVSDILGDIFGTIFDPDWIYMRALQINGQQPGDLSGTDPIAGMDGGMAFGGLRNIDAPFTALLKGEAYCATPANWPSTTQNKALPYVVAGIANALGNGDAFQSIITSAASNKIAVSVSTRWYPEFEHPNADGTVAVPDFTQDYTDLPGHNWVGKGMKTINGKPGLMVKSHQGRTIGDNGWLYFDEATVNGLLAQQGSAATTFALDANRLLSLISMIITRYPQFIPNLNLILKANVYGMV